MDNTMFTILSVSIPVMVTCIVGMFIYTFAYSRPRAYRILSSLMMLFLSADLTLLILIFVDFVKRIGV